MDEHEPEPFEPGEEVGSGIDPETIAEAESLVFPRASATQRPVMGMVASGGANMVVADYEKLPLSERREHRWVELYGLAQRLSAENDPSATRLGELLRRDCWDDDPDFDPDEDPELAPFVAELEQPKTHAWKKVATVKLEHPSPPIGRPPRPWVQRLRLRSDRSPEPRVERTSARPREQRARSSSAGGSRASPSDSDLDEPPPAAGWRRWLRRLLGGVE
jgi:hypothetical protein